MNNRGSSRSQFMFPWDSAQSEPSDESDWNDSERVERRGLVHISAAPEKPFAAAEISLCAAGLERVQAWRASAAHMEPKSPRFTQAFQR